MSRVKYKLVEILAVLLLLQEKPHGRYTLAEILDTTKARTRSILEFMGEHNLIYSRAGRAGTILSSRAKELLQELFRYIRKNDKIVSLPNTLQFEEDTCVLLIKTQNIIEGMIERDLAVRAGANGAVTMVYDGVWYVPPKKENTPAIDLEILSPEITNYNIIIITFGEKTLLGALTIAIYHLEDELHHIIGKYIDIEKIE